jgi:hypothetical protein
MYVSVLNTFFGVFIGDRKEAECHLADESQTISVSQQPVSVEPCKLKNQDLNSP